MEYTKGEYTFAKNILGFAWPSSDVLTPDQIRTLIEALKQDLTKTESSDPIVAQEERDFLEKLEKLNPD